MLMTEFTEDEICEIVSQDATAEAEERRKMKNRLQSVTVMQLACLNGA